MVQITAPIEHVPKGNPTVIGKFKIQNKLSLNEPAVWLFNMSVPDAMIGDIQVCSEKKCTGVDWRVGISKEEGEALDFADRWVAKYRQKVLLDAQKEKDIVRIGDLLSRLKKFLLPAGGQAVTPFPEEVMERFKRALDDYERGRLLTATPKKVTIIRDDLELMENQLRQIFFG
jgi:hypothetical protein